MSLHMKSIVLCQLLQPSIMKYTRPYRLFLKSRSRAKSPCARIWSLGVLLGPSFRVPEQYQVAKDSTRGSICYGKVLSCQICHLLKTNPTILSLSTHILPFPPSHPSIGQNHQLLCSFLFHRLNYL